MKKQLFLLSLIIFSFFKTFAISAIPFPITFTQPDGKTLTVMLKGDERIHWHESLDGYTLLLNSEQYLTYAKLDSDGNLVSSEHIATDINQRNIVALFFLSTINKGLFFSNAQQSILTQVWQIEDEANERAFQEKGSKGVIGTYKTLCAFVAFSDKAFIKTMSQFEGLMNQVGYSANGTGSVRDFFKEASYNQFDLIITLCGIYTAPNTSVYYAGPSAGDGTLRARELARWAALQVAAETDINFADYDSDNNGVVDGFHFIFAGVGQEAGGGAGTIWSHKWQFSPSVTKNGKSISVYSCSPELYSGTTITTVGVICHEMTHAFGAADFYDTNGATGQSYDGTGNWDLMASGSWNGSPGGNRPAHQNMYVKVQFGWVVPTVLSSASTISNMPNAAENAVAYRINTATTNEYFLLENRQQLKFDTSIPGNGLLIYRVHSTIGSSGINDTHPQKMYPVCASSTYSLPTGAGTYGSISSAGTPFPGSSNKTTFTDATTPSMKSWANANTNKPIANITNINRLVSFDFMGGGAPTSFTIAATAGTNGTISPNGSIIVNTGANQTFTITPNTYYNIATVLVNGTNNMAAVTSGTYTFTNVLANHTIHATFSPKTYVVFFDANCSSGCSGTMNAQNFTYGVSQNLTLNAYNKSGHTFVNWNTAADGSGITYTNGQNIYISGSFTLYAQWAPKTQITINETPQTFTYDGNVKAFLVTSNPVVTGFNVVYSPISPINVGIYNVTITRPEDVNYLAFNTTIIGGLVINKASIAKPTITSGTLTYNGSAQSPTIATNAAYTISNNVQTNAGNYNATVTLIDLINYQWADGTITALSLPWSIATKALTINGFNITKVYDGNSNVTNWGTLTFAGLVGGQTSTVNLAGVVGNYNNSNAGNEKPVSYSGTFAMSGGTALSTNYSLTQPTGLTGVISVIQIPKPTVTSGALTYNGMAQSPTIATNAAYSITGNSQTNAGSYNAIVTLNDIINYQWFDATTTPLSLAWSIDKATYNMAAVSFEDAIYQYDGTPKTLEISGTPPSGVSVNYDNNTQTEVGVYTATANFSGDATNYNIIEPITATLTITALPTFTITVNAGAGGTASGGGVYTLGEVITITATPNEFYNFVKWDDENLDNPREITVTENATFTAIFIINDIIDNNLSSIKIFPNPTKDQLIVDNGKLIIKQLEIYDIAGKQLSTIHYPLSTINLTHLQAGVYFIKLFTENGICVRKINKN